jgi:hypothetical protein
MSGELTSAGGIYALVIVKKRNRKICAVKGCGRKRPKRGRICSGCLMLRWRTNHPERSAYSAIKESARKRKIFFSLTFKEFSDWARKHNYVDNRGRASGDFHVDRIRDEEGYHLGNIQVLTAADNTRKELRRRHAAREKIKAAGQEIPWPLLPINDPPDPDAPPAVDERDPY